MSLLYPDTTRPAFPWRRLRCKFCTWEPLEEEIWQQSQKPKGTRGVLRNEQRHLYLQRTGCPQPSSSGAGASLGMCTPTLPAGAFRRVRQRIRSSSQPSRDLQPPPNPQDTRTAGAPQHPHAATGHSTVSRVRPSRPRTVLASLRAEHGAGKQRLLLISVIKIRLPRQPGFRLTFSY